MHLRHARRCRQSRCAANCISAIVNAFVSSYVQKVLLQEVSKSIDMLRVDEATNPMQV